MEDISTNNTDSHNKKGKIEKRIKVVLVGNSSVGKSSLLERYTTDKFSYES